MKQQVSPVAATVAILVVALVAVLAYVKFGTVSHNQPPPPSMPESVQKQWQEIAGSAPPGKSGSPGTGTIPGGGPTSNNGGGGAPIMGGGAPAMGGNPPGMGGSPTPMTGGAPNMGLPAGSSQ